MKTFFTQPIGNLSRQNAILFLAINVVFIAVEADIKSKTRQ